MAANSQALGKGKIRNNSAYPLPYFNPFVIIEGRWGRMPLLNAGSSNLKAADTQRKRAIMKKAESAEVYEEIEEGKQRSDPTIPTDAALSATNPSTAIASAVSDVLSVTTPAQAAPISKFASRLAAVATPREVPATVAGYTPTDEQRTILETVLEVLYGDGPKVLVIEAGAGAGKTSTLKMLEEVLPGAGQYTAFNKSLVDDSRPKFHKARCNTTHSLAFQPCGRDYSHRLNCGRVKSSDVAKLLGIQDYTVDLGPIPQGGAEWDKAMAKAGYDDKNPPPATFAPRAYKVLNAGMLAGQVTKALRKFSQSSEREIKPENFEYIGGIDHKTPDGKRGWENNRKLRDYLMPFAEKAWADVVKKDGDFPFTHDYYVKIWQLGTPVIGADYILLDEDQDTAAVFADIIRRQRQAMVVLVGDENQSIYGWRGAINATRLFPEAKVCYLTQSFRFGQTVADVANSILKGLAEPTKLRMRGLPNQPTRVVMGAGREADEDRSADHVGRVCYLYRTNAGAVGRILREHEQGRNGCLIGNIDDILSFVEGALDLQRGRRTTNAELAAFETWAEVCKYVEEDPDGEDLKLNVDLVEDFGAQAIISALKNMPKEEYADFVCSTAHKSKGREWPTVVLGQDFPPAVNMGDEDRRLLYVAATRAKLVLDLSVCTPFYPYTDREGITTPGIEVEYTVPMPTREDLQAWITAKAAPQSPTKPVPNVGINDSGVMAVAAPAANPAPANGSSGGDYTWGKVGEDWCVRGPVDQKIGSRVEVKKRDGRSSTETLRSVVKKLTDVWFYGVK